MRNIYLLLLFLSAQLSYGQFVSAYHEDKLLFDHNLIKESRFVLSRSERPKRLTWVLPSFSTTMISPQLTYGDLYVEESKTLDLTLGADSQQDFDLQLNARVSYGGLSYRMQNLRFSIFHEALFDTRMSIPNHLFTLVTEGNSSLVNDNVDINPQVLFSSTHKWALGFDYQKDNLVLGVQANVYTGNAYLNTHNSSLNIGFEDNFFGFNFDKDILVQSSGAIDYQAIDSIEVVLGDNAISPAGLLSNLGIGLSAQFSYQLTDNFRLMGRLEDLGVIKWKNETQILEEQTKESFSGFDVRQSYLTGETINLEDTLYAKLDIAHRSADFTTRLQTSFFVGATYRINDYVTTGLLVRSKNNGINQLFFLEPFVTFYPLENTSVTLANFMQKTAPINPKITLRTEINETLGAHLALVNPWRVSKYYDTKMIHAQLGVYLKFLRGR